jgi:prepilin-type N-terminal cleavage/methylation domain-containing protein
MNRSGFSLLELMIVLMLLAGISVIAMPSVRRLSSKTDKQLLEQKKIEAELDARYKSNASGRVILLVFDENANSVIYNLDNLPSEDIISAGVWIAPE